MDDDIGREHRILHRMFDGDDPRDGRDPEAADDRGLPRAHRGVPDLRSRLRIHGALHRVRDRDPLRHPGAPVQPREDDRPPAQGQKRDNPSNYSLVVLSEGASWEGYTGAEREAGRHDAYGHAKKINVGEALGKSSPGTARRPVLSDLTYDLRSGEPDFIDKMVAITFANMAVDCIIEGKSGLMTGIVDGCYALAPIPDPKLGPRKIDVATMYNVNQYRPNYANKLGLPVFLHRAS